MRSHCTSQTTHSSLFGATYSANRATGQDRDRQHVQRPPGDRSSEATRTDAAQEVCVFPCTRCIATRCGCGTRCPLHSKLPWPRPPRHPLLSPPAPPQVFACRTPPGRPMSFDCHVTHAVLACDLRDRELDRGSGSLHSTTIARLGLSFDAGRCGLQAVAGGTSSGTHATVGEIRYCKAQPEWRHCFDVRLGFSLHGTACESLVNDSISIAGQALHGGCHSAPRLQTMASEWHRSSVSISHIHGLPPASPFNPPSEFTPWFSWFSLECTDWCLTLFPAKQV